MQKANKGIGAANKLHNILPNLDYGDFIYDQPMTHFAVK